MCVGSTTRNTRSLILTAMEVGFAIDKKFGLVEKFQTPTLVSAKIKWPKSFKNIYTIFILREKYMFLTF